MNSQQTEDPSASSMAALLGALDKEGVVYHRLQSVPILGDGVGIVYSEYDYVVAAVSALRPSAIQLVALIGLGLEIDYWQGVYAANYVNAELDSMTCVFSNQTVENSLFLKASKQPTRDTDDAFNFVKDIVAVSDSALRVRAALNGEVDSPFTQRLAALGITAAIPPASPEALNTARAVQYQADLSGPYRVE